MIAHFIIRERRKEGQEGTMDGGLDSLTRFESMFIIKIGN